MQIDFISVFISIVSLVLLAVPGFILTKTKLIPQKAESAFSTLVLYGCQPVLVFMGFQGTKFDANIGINVLYVMLITALVHLAMAGIMYLSIRNKDNSAKKRVIRYAGMFSNCGFMGLPFLQLIFQDSPYLGEVTIYAAAVIAVFNIANWTLGVFFITEDKTKVSLTKIILNPTIIAVMLGLIVFYTVKVPFVDLTTEGTFAHNFVSKLMQTLTTIGNMVTPLSMTVIGMKLAGVSLKKLFLDGSAYLVSFFKLIIMSLVTMAIVYFLPVSTAVKYVTFFLLSMPCATSTALFSSIFGGDGDSAVVYVLLTSIISILTVPLMFLLFSTLVGSVI